MKFFEALKGVMLPHFAQVGFESRVAYIEVLECMGILLSHKDDVGDAGFDAIFDDVIDNRPIENRQQLLLDSGGFRQHAGAEATGGDDCGSDFHLVAPWEIRAWRWLAMAAARVAASGASTMMRAMGSVPEGRTLRRPVSSSSAVWALMKACTSGLVRADLSARGMLVRACGTSVS